MDSATANGALTNHFSLQEASKLQQELQIDRDTSPLRATSKLKTSRKQSGAGVGEWV